MSTRSPQATIISICVLDLDPRVEDKRLALHSLLVQTSLIDHPDGCTLPDIESSIEGVLEQPGILSQQMIIDSIESAKSEGLLVELENGVYQLEVTRAKELVLAIKIMEGHRDAFRKGVQKAVEKRLSSPLDPGVAESLLDSIELFLQSIIHADIVEIGSGSTTLADLVNHSAEDASRKTVDEVLSECISDKLGHLATSQVSAGIRDYFRILPESGRKYLEVLQIKVIGGQILRIDPEDQDHLHKLFIKRRLYLDTNVIIAWFFDTDAQHDLATDIVAASKALGCNLFVTHKTVEEFQGQLTEARREYKKIRGSAFALSLGPAYQNTILRAYFLKRTQNPNLDWDAYIGPYGIIEEFLFANDVLVDDGGEFGVADADLVNTITPVLTTYKPNSTSNAIYHDAFNICHIDHLRPNFPTDEFGCQIWLLTLDNAILRVQQALHNEYSVDGSFKLPIACHVSTWGNRIARYQNALTFVYDDYIAYLVRSKLGLIAVDRRGIKADFVELLSKALVEVDVLLKLPESLVRNVVTALQENAEARQLVTELAYEDEEKWTELKRSRLLEQLLDIVESAKKEADLTLDEQRAHLEARIEILEKQLNEQILSETQLENYVSQLHSDLDLLETERDRQITSLKEELAEQVDKAIIKIILERIGIRRPQ